MTGVGTIVLIGLGAWALTKWKPAKAAPTIVDASALVAAAAQIVQAAPEEFKEQWEAQTWLPAELLPETIPEPLVCSLGGTVTDAITGKPVEGVQIRLKAGTTSWQTYSDENGKYLFKHWTGTLSLFALPTNDPTRFPYTYNLGTMSSIYKTQSVEPARIVKGHNEFNFSLRQRTGLE